MYIYSNKNKYILRGFEFFNSLNYNFYTGYC